MQLRPLNAAQAVLHHAGATRPPCTGNGMQTGKTIKGETLRVREVWDDNLEAEFAIIRSIIEEYPYVAMVSWMALQPRHWTQQQPHAWHLLHDPFAQQQGEGMQAAINKQLEVHGLMQLGCVPSWHPSSCNC